jgi:hypothetical protein
VSWTDFFSPFDYLVVSAFSVMTLRTEKKEFSCLEERSGRDE